SSSASSSSSSSASSSSSLTSETLSPWSADAARAGAGTAGGSAAGVIADQEGIARRTSRMAASSTAGDKRQGTCSRKIMVNLLSRKRPEPAAPNAGAGETARDNREPISKRVSA